MSTVAVVHKFRGSDIEEAQRAGLSVANLEDIRAAGIDPYDSIEALGNIEVNGGLNLMLNLLIGGGGTTLANGNARLCVGDGGGSVPTVAATDTALTATSNRYNQAAASTYPSVAAAVLTIQSVFSTANANFVWNEWAIDSGGSSGSGACSGMFNHRGVNLGTKTSAAAWTLTATISQS